LATIHQLYRQTDNSPIAYRKPLYKRLPPKECSRVHQNTPFSFRKMKKFRRGNGPLPGHFPQLEGDTPSHTDTLGTYSSSTLPPYKTLDRSLVVFCSYSSAYRHAWRHTRMCLFLFALLLRFNKKLLYPVFYYCNLSTYDQNVTTTTTGLQSTFNT